MPVLNSTAPAPAWWQPREGVAKSPLPADYTIRPLERADFERGFLECLSQLTTMGQISMATFNERLDYMQKHSDTYMPIVIADGRNRIVACGTLVVERKFIRGCGQLGHIEDIVVSDDQRGRGLGKIVIQQLKEIALQQGCYKITLDCDVKNEQFYAKCGFETKGLQMVIYNRQGCSEE